MKEGRKGGGKEEREKKRREKKRKNKIRIILHYRLLNLSGHGVGYTSTHTISIDGKDNYY